MKKILFSVLLILSIGASAQINNIYSADSSVVVNSIYAGLLNQTYLPLNNLRATINTDFRVGAKMTWQIKPWLSAISFAHYARAQKGDDFGGNFWLKLQNKQRRFSLEIGKLPGAATEIRPTPLSADGQFEAVTQALIPGTSVGAKISYKINPGANQDKLVFSISNRNDRTEYAARVQMGKFDLIQAYATASKTSTLGLSFKNERLYSLLIGQSSDTLGGDKIIANFTNVTILPAKKIDLFFNSSCSFKTGKIKNTEIGISKNFEMKHLKGMIALAYNQEKRAMNGILFLHP
jgi:hypothetical protein